MVNAPHPFSGAVLKNVAIVTMAIDHTAAILLRNHPGKLYDVMRGIGRIAFPIFCFLLVEGFLHTRSRKKYALRLLVFALISEVPFDLALFGSPLDIGHQNVFFTLLLGLLMMWGWDVLNESIKKGAERTMFQLLCVVLFCLAAWMLHTDYDYRGILLIFVFFLLRYQRRNQVILGALATVWEWPWVLLAFPFIALYNGKRGHQIRWFFYVFYPSHLLLLFALSRIL